MQMTYSDSLYFSDHFSYINYFHPSYRLFYMIFQTRQWPRCRFKRRRARWRPQRRRRRFAGNAIPVDQLDPAVATTYGTRRVAPRRSCKRHLLGWPETWPATRSSGDRATAETGSSIWARVRRC